MPLPSNLRTTSGGKKVPGLQAIPQWAVLGSNQ